MDQNPERPPEDARVAAIRVEIDEALARLSETIDALEHKFDVPARLGDALGATAVHLFNRLSPPADEPEDEPEDPPPVSEPLD